jgi:radical SAM protein with 4Fe4S-binding SPASM domain
LRDDFPKLYLTLKRQGLLVSIFTNATLVTEEHIRLFRAYPPHAVEVTVYGASETTYERVTRRPGSYAAFRRGLDLLFQGGVPVRLKAVALRSNLAEFPAIARFCRERTGDDYRFDPLLHLRLDGDQGRNAEIAAERLTLEEIVALEQADPERVQALQRTCRSQVAPEPSGSGDDALLHCGAGANSFSVSYDGRFRLCSTLCHPACVYDLKRGSLEEAWHEFVPRVRALRSERASDVAWCGRCRLQNLCPWCPATAYLESGELDALVERFCRVAHARARALGIDDG